VNGRGKTIEELERKGKYLEGTLDDVNKLKTGWLRREISNRFARQNLAFVSIAFESDNIAKLLFAAFTSARFASRSTFALLHGSVRGLSAKFAWAIGTWRGQGCPLSSTPLTRL